MFSKDFEDWPSRKLSMLDQLLTSKVRWKFSRKRKSCRRIERTRCTRVPAYSVLRLVRGEIYCWRTTITSYYPGLLQEKLAVPCIWPELRWVKIIRHSLWCLRPPSGLPTQPTSTLTYTLHPYQPTDQKIFSLSNLWSRLNNIMYSKSIQKFKIRSYGFWVSAGGGEVACLVDALSSLWLPQH